MQYRRTGDGAQYESAQGRGRDRSVTDHCCLLAENLSDDIQTAVKKVLGVREVKVTLSEMTPEERETVLQNTQPGLSEANQFKVSRIVAVMSGKGGVGKSSVTTILGVALAR